MVGVDVGQPRLADSGRRDLGDPDGPLYSRAGSILVFRPGRKRHGGRGRRLSARRAHIDRTMIRSLVLALPLAALGACAWRSRPDLRTRRGALLSFVAASIGVAGLHAAGRP